jgi:glycosyltransferase involved in cell wall biosynthesis
VLAFRRGSVPEVVAHGVTGYVVDTLPEMVDAVSRIHEIDPYICRRWVEERFNVARMTDDYLAAYRRVLAGSAARLQRPEQLAAGMVAAAGSGEIGLGTGL